MNSVSNNKPKGKSLPSSHPASGVRRQQRNLDCHNHQDEEGMEGFLNCTLAFSKSPFSCVCTPVGITSTRHVTTAKRMSAVQCCMILGEPQRERCHTGIPNSQHWQKAPADSKTHLHRAEDRTTGTPALQKEDSAKSLLVFLKENSSSLRLAPNLRLKHFNFKTVIPFRELRGRVWETQTRHY